VGVLNEMLTRLLSLLPRIMTINPEESGVRVTLGKYMKDCGPGWYIVWPIIQELDYVVVTTSMTEKAYIDARTRDGTPLTVGVSLVYRVTNARSAIFNVDNFEDLLNAIGPDAARKVIEESSDSDLASIETVRKAILDEVRAACRGWGVKVERVLLPCCTSCKTIRIIGNDHVVVEE
jgi:regulator of protease activity HflC (stomatin/prohibitin superfamily)